MKRAAVIGALMLALAPIPAHAHLVTTGLGPFYDGISHLALTPEDLLPALALGLLAGLRGAAHGRRAMFVLPVGWLLGGLVGLAANASLSPALATVSFLVVGGLVAADAKLPLPATTGLAAAFGLFHGLLNGGALGQARLGALGLAGIVVAVFVLVALAAGFVAPLRAAWARVAVRVAGSWIAAIGVLMLGWALRGAS